MQNEKRVYQRGDHFQCTALISEDRQNWQEAYISDLSSGGLYLVCEKGYQRDELLWFDIQAEGIMTEFKVAARGRVCRVQYTGAAYAHGIAFVELDDDTRVMIDENVLSMKRLGQDQPQSLVD